MIDKIFFFALIPFLISLASSYILYIWFDGGKVFVEYANLFRLQKMFKPLKNYNLCKTKGLNDTFLEYIQNFYDCFFTRLITCEKCLSFWICFFFLYYYSMILLFFCSPLFVTFIFFTPIYIFALPAISLIFLKVLKKNV